MNGPTGTQLHTHAQIHYVVCLWHGTGLSLSVYLFFLLFCSLLRSFLLFFLCDSSQCSVLSVSVKPHKWYCPDPVLLFSISFSSSKFHILKFFEIFTVFIIHLSWENIIGTQLIEVVIVNYTTARNYVKKSVSIRVCVFLCYKLDFFHKLYYQDTIWWIFK